MKKNMKLKTKNDVAAALLELVRPLRPFYNEGHTWLEVGHIGVHYGEKTARMEGFARVIWGLGPLWAGMDTLSPELREEAEDWRIWCLEGIINGTDPSHPGYWGKSYDFDQKIVEMAAIANAITVATDKVWEPLTQVQKDNLYNFLNQANFQEMHTNNWVYFRILINMTFRKLGLEWNEERLLGDRANIERCYVADGWYYDGHAGQVDYYIPFAMHFYALIYSNTMKDFEPEYCKTLQARAEEFSHDYVYWFGNDGNEIPFGRSLTYRFAHSSYFGAMAYAGIEGVGYGVMKRLTLRNIQNWINRPIYDNAGVITVGYGYPNLFMSERYNGAGSPYWAFKSFIILALPDDHPFWLAEEQDYDYEEQKHLKHPYMLITHDDNDHVLAYTAGQHNTKVQGHCPEKYEKFVYSNQFGFSVSRENDLVGGAFDNTLAASYLGDNNYRMHFGWEKYEVTDKSVRVNYKLLRDVDVKSVIIPCGAWHVRVHNINTVDDIEIADGGFSIEPEPCFHAVTGDSNGKYTPDQIHNTEDSSFAVLPWGVSGVKTYTGGQAVMGDCLPNTNVFYYTSILPMVCKTLKPGEHTIITAVFGDRSDKAQEKMQDVPQVEIIDGKIIVKTKDKTIEETFLA